MATEKLFNLPSLSSVHHTDEFDFCKNKIIVFGNNQQNIKSLKRQNSAKRPQTSISITKSHKLRMQFLKQKKQNTQKNMINQAKKTYNKQNTKSIKELQKNKIKAEQQKNKQSKVNEIKKLTPEDKLLKQIENNSIRNGNQRLFTQFTQKNKSSARSSCKKSNQEYSNEIVPKNLSQSRESRKSVFSKQITSYKLKNPFPLRKSICMNPNDLKKFGINQMSQKKIFDKKQKQAELKQSSNNNIVEQQQQDVRNLYNPFFKFLKPKDKYNMCYETYLEDLQENFIQGQQKRVFPNVIDENQKRRNTYFNNEVNKLKQTIQQQNETIKKNQIQLNQLKNKNKTQNVQQNINDQNKQIKQSQRQKRELSNISEEQNNALISPRQAKLNQIQRKITQQIQQIDQQLKYKNSQNFGLGESQNLVHHAKQTNLLMINSKTVQDQNYKSAISSFYKQSTNQALIPKNRAIAKFVKRADIVDSFNRDFYQQDIDIFQVMISKNDNLKKKKMHNYGQPIQQSQSYLQTFFSEMEHSEINNQQEEVFQDIQFQHQNIFLSQSEVHWIYNSPEPQCSLFPNKIILPNHYIMTQSYLDNGSLKKKTIPFIQLLNYLIKDSPSTITQIIQPAIKNVYGVWLWNQGKYEFIYVDGYFPYDGKLNTLYGWIDQYIWFAVLSKAVAKLFGGYEFIEKLTIQDSFKLLTGKNIQKLQKPQQLIDSTQKQEMLIKYLRMWTNKNQGNKIFIYNKKLGKIFFIKWIKNQQIRLISCNPNPTKITLELIHFLNYNDFQIFSISSQCKKYITTKKYDLTNQKAIFSYHLKCSKQTNINLSTVKLQKQQDLEQYETFMKKKSKRRILLYQIKKHMSKMGNSKQQQMIFKCMSTTKVQLENNVQQLSCVLKKGQYKIFIECGSASLQKYFNSQRRDIYSNGTKKIKTSQNQQKEFSQSNILSVTSDKVVILQYGKSLQNINRFETNDKNDLQKKIIVEAEDEKSFYKVSKKMNQNQYS